MLPAKTSTGALVALISATLALAGPPVAAGASSVSPQPRFAAAPLRRGAAEAAASTGAGRILVTTAGPPAPVLAGASRVTRLAREGIEILSVPDVAAAIAAYRSAPGIRSVEADRTARIASAPNDHYYGAQWTLHPSSGPAAPSPFTLNWEPVYPQVQGDGAVVAVLDTGYQPGGSDQPVNLRLNQARNFVTPGADTSDDNGHGTFVTNMIAEATDNATGAAGIAPHATIVPVKVLAADGTGDLGVVAQGIDYAVSIGARVINLSLAGDASPTLCRAVAVAAQSAVVVAASGNDATTGATKPIAYPAACPGALAIGSVALDGSRPSYADTGCPMAAVAPGGDDLHAVDPASAQSDWVLQQGYDATVGDPAFGTFQYFEEKGTSMSSAQAAGEAALLIGAGATVSQARRLMLGTARPVSSPDFTPEYGSGALDITAAVTALHTRPWTAPMLRGYRIVTATGRVNAIGDECLTAGFQGQVTGPLARPVVGAAATPSGNGYWLVASDGGIFSFGDATFAGSTGAITLNKPIVGMASTPSGHGYWLVASDGGIFSFGDATFAGSTGAITLNKPIVGMASTPSGHGYWLVASDGGIFSFGDAAFAGSTGAIRLTSPIVGITPSTDGRGYLLTASDGGVFNFGDAPFFGSAAGLGGQGVAITPEPWPGL